MNRWWLVPYNEVIKRTVYSIETLNDHSQGPNGWPYEVETERTVTDGTGPVNGFRPIARLLQFFGVAIRVHEILRSDVGCDPHDHPWPYLTIILKGGYWERRYDADGSLQSTEWHGPGSIIYRPANSWHMLVLFADQPATTLFITGKKAQRWGFNVGGEKVDCRTYLDAKHGD